MTQKVGNDTWVVTQGIGVDTKVGGDTENGW